LISPQTRAAASTVPLSSTPRFEVPMQPVLMPPEFTIDIADAQPDSAVTAAVPPAAQILPQAAIAHTIPLQISQAEYLRAPVLAYPRAALAARREGSVGLRVLVGEDGRVLEVMVERPSGFAPFDEAACSAVRAALFRPYTVNGEPRTVLVRIPIDFTLKRRG
jgi:protein TonB